MLVNNNDLLIKSTFTDETEIENVVKEFSEQLFGSSIIFLPKAKIATAGGKGTVPDGFVIDIQSEEWFIVEAERAVHGTWEHIAPQISKQLAAVESKETREMILNLALGMIKQDKLIREIFSELGVGDLEIHVSFVSVRIKQRIEYHDDILQNIGMLGSGRGKQAVHDVHRRFGAGSLVAVNAVGKPDDRGSTVDQVFCRGRR